MEGQPGLRLFGLPLSDYYAYSSRAGAGCLLLAHLSHLPLPEGPPLSPRRTFWPPGSSGHPLRDSLAHEVPRFYPGRSREWTAAGLEPSGSHLSFSQLLPEQLVPGRTLPAAQRLPGPRRQVPDSSAISAWPEELIARLAGDIEAAAVRAVRRFGEFHLAFPGGSSPVALFQQLAAGHYSFPWAHTHLWLVDERCVSLWDPRTNFQGLQTHLLQHVRVPPLQRPPHARAPAPSGSGAEEDQGAQAYAEEISALVTNGSRLGAAGHGNRRAHGLPLPQSPAGLDGEQLVVLTTSLQPAPAHEPQPAPHQPCPEGVAVWSWAG